MADLAAVADEWRVEIDLDDERHGYRLGERLRALKLDDEARARLGDRVIVTRDGARMFLYAGTEGQAREAERVARDLVAAEGLSAEIALRRWHPDEEAWKDASVPLPQTEEEREAEQGRRESAGRWEQDWEVRVDLPSHRATIELARRLSDEGIEVRRHWRYLLVGAPTEERAAELGERIRAEAPPGTEIHVVPVGVAEPVFVAIGARIPGIGRDLGL
jgi:hypothetical protein